MEMGGNFCQILELGGTTIKGRRVVEWGKVNEIMENSSSTRERQKWENRGWSLFSLLL